MKLLIATAGFKEGPGAERVCELVQQGTQDVPGYEFTVIRRPLADGGTGFAPFLKRECGGQEFQCEVQGPHAESQVSAKYVVLSDGPCVLESSSAAGLALLPQTHRNPLLTSTAGVGETVRHAYESGQRDFLIGCGDSATNDLGIGFAAALGVTFLSGLGEPVPPCGQYLSEIRTYELGDLASDVIAQCRFEVACNPSSILCGEYGVSRVYAPQKGADAAGVAVLHRGIKSLASLLESKTNRELKYLPGAGGAGGLAGMIYALFGGRLTFSFDVVRRFTQLDDHLREADLILTCEGFLDSRTLHGKLPGAVALYAKRYDKPVVAIVGGMSDDLNLLYYSGFDAVEVVTKRPGSIAEAMQHVDTWLPDATARLLRKVMLGAQLAEPRGGTDGGG